MSQRHFSADELLASHDYARPQNEAGFRLHGGHDAEGRYISPRSLHRSRAIEAWSEGLRERGGEPLQADASLLEGIRCPNFEQMKLLLRSGLGQTFWNTLTITGHIEGRGRILAELEFPNFADHVVQDVSEMAVGHLNGGLLRAHGLDEGGEPDKGIGGHDVMWFALRDLAFGPTDFDEPETPERIGRPDAARRRAPQIAEPVERTVEFLLNLLMIEFRAELGFQLTEDLLRDPELFKDRRRDAEKAAELVERIRLDEEIHVTSLRLILGEIRGLDFKVEGKPGETVSGATLVDPLWSGIVEWATVQQPRAVALQQRTVLSKRILAHADGEVLLERFESLGEWVDAVA
ncbi:MAG: hypothetical protein VCC02_03440 [Myxococcota bacterium]